MKPLDLSRLMDSPSFRQTFQVRSVTGNRDNTTGKWEETSFPPRDAIGSVQFATEKDMQALRAYMEGGERIKEAIRIYTKEALTSGESGGGRTGDFVLWKGHTWQVVRTPNMEAHGYFKCLAVRVDNG